MTKNIITYLLIAFGLLGNAVYAQVEQPGSRQNIEIKNPEGTEFWLCFMKNYKKTAKNASEKLLILELFITSGEDSEVSIEVQSIGFRKTLSIPAGTVKNIRLDPLAQVSSSEIIERKHAVHITSDNPITVYGLNRRKQTTDTYLGLPLNVLGKSYRAMCYDRSEGLMPQFAIVATENNTEVIITPTVETHGGKKPNVPFKISLNRGDVYQVSSKLIMLSKKKCDLTGSLITANKKISVFSGHQCSYVPNKIIACNHLVEQLPPIPSWGKHFYLGMLKPRSNYTFRALASQDSTKLFLDAEFIKMLNAGEFYESTLRHPSQVAANKPILVSQYSQGFQNGDSIGDPMMLLISPTQQFLRKYRFATPVNGFWEHYINVVIPTVATASMKLNGIHIDTSLFQPLGLSRYSIAYLKVNFGTHVIEGSQPFGMYSYGFGFDKDEYDAYGNIGGQSFVEYVPAKDTLPPMAELRQEGGKAKLIIRDDRVDDTGIEGIYIEQNGLDAVHQKIVEASPQTTIDIKFNSDAEIHRLVVEAADLTGNVSLFTVCYVYRPSKKAIEYVLSEGTDADCIVDPGLIIGAFGRLLYLSHTSDFSSSGGLKANGSFSDASGMGGYGGVMVGRKISKDLVLSARLSFENYGGVLTAPDSVVSRYRDPASGELKPFQEARDLTIDGLFMNLAFAGEYYLEKYLYLFGGFNVAMNLSKSITVNKRILIPQDYTYGNDLREIKDSDAPAALSSINSMRLGLFGGAGVIYKIDIIWSVNIEAAYTNYLGNIINDGEWGLTHLSLSAGVRYNLDIFD